MALPFRWNCGVIFAATTKGRGSYEHSRSSLERIGVSDVSGVAQTAYAESITACEQTVNYTIIPSTTGLPESAHAFSGVYIGNWGGGQLCHVLIVEDVKKDGAVSVKYVYGTNPGWGIRQPGVRQWSGTISGNTLMLRGDNLSVDYVMSGDGTLAATYTQNNQQMTTIMKRK